MNVTILEQVVSILTEKGGFQRQPRLVLVDDVDFEFDAILRGPSDTEGLVVLIERDLDGIASVPSLIQSMSELMLRSGSTRPLALVLLSDVFDSAIVRDLWSVCRVIAVSVSADNSLTDELRCLLPLELPEPAAPRVDPTRLLLTALGSASVDPFVSSLLAAGRRSASSVAQEVINAVNTVIGEALDGTSD